jgi:hypothetical protein
METLQNLIVLKDGEAYKTVAALIGDFIQGLLHA